VWDDAAHLCLLQAVFTHVTFTAEEWHKILGYTEARGYNYSAGAAVYFSPSCTFLAMLLIFPKFTPP
jgi:hypothetical protein